MPRTKKKENLLKHHINLSIPHSFSEYISRESESTTSTHIQRLIAADILDVAFNDFTNELYPTKVERDYRYHLKDKLSQEIIRAARWLVESDILTVLVRQDGLKVLMRVKWLISDTINWVTIDFTKNGFRHVIYDSIVTGDKYAEIPSNYDELTTEQELMEKLIQLGVNTRSHYNLPCVKIKVVNNWVNKSRNRGNK